MGERVGGTTCCLVLGENKYLSCSEMSALCESDVGLWSLRVSYLDRFGLVRPSLNHV